MYACMYVCMYVGMLCRLTLSDGLADLPTVQICERYTGGLYRRGPTQHTHTRRGRSLGRWHTVQAARSKAIQSKCAYVCRCVGMYVCMYVCMSVCMHVCMYVGRYVHNSFATNDQNQARS